MSLLVRRAGRRLFRSWAVVASTSTGTGAFHRLPPLALSAVDGRRGFHVCTPVFGALQEFLLADIGEGIAEVELLSWSVAVGDRVQQFQPMCQVQSDKATVDISSRFDGIVKSLNYQPGQMIPVGSSLVTIQLDGDTPSTSPSPAAVPTGDTASTSPSPAAVPTDVPAPIASANNTIDKFLTTPAVRRLAKEHNLDLKAVTATGPKGRILKEDVLAFLKDPSVAPVEEEEEEEEAVVHKTAPKDKVVAISGLRRRMVQTMNESNKVPTFTLHEELGMDAVAAIKEELKPIALERGIRLTFMPFFIKSASLALLKYPSLNSLVQSECTEFRQMASHNVSVAMDTPRGLLVPNIKNCQHLSILDIAQELQRLHELGIAGQLGSDDLNGGTFSLSNIGSIGGTYATPLIMVPQVMIGAIGSIQNLPRFGSDSGVVVARRIAHVSWSADHRILDGATVARFSNLFKQLIEQPHRMLLDTR